MACKEQNLNSTMVGRAEGEKMPSTDMKDGKSCRIECYVHNGGRLEVYGVEVLLNRWLYCIRQFSEAQVRYVNRFHPRTCISKSLTISTVNARV